MFVFLNQLSSEEPICIDVANIREFYPEEVEVSDGNTRRGTLIIMYRSEPWIVKQSVNEVFHACQKAKRGEL